ncbi:MFS transporter [bacterium]|nr:MFS transporter [bacterium]
MNGSHARRFVAAAWLSLFAEGFVDNTRGPLLPRVLESFHVNATWGSLFLVMGSIAGLPGSLAAGALVGLVGPRATLRFMAVLLAGGLALVALAGEIDRFWLVPVGAGIMGVGLAGVGVVANYYVALATPEESRGRALARLHVLYAAASLIVPLVIVEATRYAGWPLVTAAAAIVPGLLIPLSFLVPWVAPAARRAPSSPSPALPLRGRENPEEALPHRGRENPEDDAWKPIVGYSLALSLFVVAEVTVSCWLQLHAEKNTDYEKRTCAALVSAFFVGLGAARVLGGAFLGEKHAARAALLGAGASAICVLLGLHVHVVFLSLEGFTIGIVFPAAMAALTLELPRSLHGRAIGVVSASYSTALALAHFLVGRASDAYGTRVALHVSPACALLGVVVLALTRARAAR